MNGVLPNINNLEYLITSKLELSYENEYKTWEEYFRRRFVHGIGDIYLIKTIHRNFKTETVCKLVNSKILVINYKKILGNTILRTLHQFKPEVKIKNRIRQSVTNSVFFTSPRQYFAF